MRLRDVIRRIATRSLIVFLTLGCCVVLLELGLRIVGEGASNMTDGFFEKHGSSYRLRRNLTKVTKWPGFTYVVHTNELGLRDSCQGPHGIADDDFLLFIGASQTFGNGVDYEDSFVGIVDATLKSRSVPTLNLAVGGHNIVDQLLLLREFYEVMPHRPGTVVVCLNPLMLSNYDQSHEAVVVRGGYLFDEGNWVLPYAKVMLANLSASYTFLRNAIRQVTAQRANTPGPNSSLLELYGPNQRLREAGTVAQLYETLDELIELIRSNGGTSLLVYLPAVPGLRADERASELGLNGDSYDPFLFDALLMRYGDERGLPVINPHEEMLAFARAGEALSFECDAHYNEFTNGLVARVILKTLLRHPNLCKAEERESQPSS